MTPFVPPSEFPPNPRSARAVPDFIDRLVAHDTTAFEELVRDHGPRMLGVASRYLPRVMDAEDALQDAFVNVVRSIGSFQRGSSLDTWLHRVVVNCALMSLRRKRRRPETAIEASALDGGASSPWRRWPPPSAHDVLANEETRHAVRLAVDGLPEAQRSILLLRDVDALELKAIAVLLDVGLSTVKIRLHRARHALQTALGPKMAEFRS
jgi:RNA polymerase sigma-70 factor (ECF subfamily)